MGKAIFVTDMPRNCYECDIHNYHECAITTTNIKDYMDEDGRPPDCPFKELPHKKDLNEIEEHTLGEDYIWSEGWNACIDEIIKDKVEVDI